MKKDTAKEEEITPENMQKQIEETKEEAHETVKSKKSKYKQEENFIHRVGESIKEGYRLLGKKTKNFFKKIKKVGKKKQKQEKKGQEQKDNQKEKKNDKE
jgi:hypothetical protein